MSTIIDKIKASVEGVTNCPFYYHSEGDLNLILDSVSEFPCAIATLLDSNNVEIDASQIRERVRIAIFFVQPTEFNFEALENEELIQACKTLAFKWVNGLLSHDSELTLESVNDTTRIYDQYDTILTGFAVNVSLVENYGMSRCDLK